MRNRILKRPMFRLGGSAENEGIMDGMRKRFEQGTKPEDIDSTYQEGDFNVNPTNQTTQRTGERPSFRDILMAPGSNLSPFLTEFGLNLLSQPPTGNIFQTAATAAKTPFQRLQARRARGEERDFEKELLERKLESQEKIAGGVKTDREYQAAYKLGLDEYKNPSVAANYASFYTEGGEQAAKAKLGTQFGGIIDQDLRIQGTDQKLGKNLEKQNGLHKTFYDIYTGNYKKLIKRQDGKYAFIDTTLANVEPNVDIEGETLPKPTETDKRNEYRDKINPELKKIREKKTKEIQEKFGVEDDVDI
mgnify:CR=1 FL=1